MFSLYESFRMNDYAKFKNNKFKWKHKQVYIVSCNILYNVPAAQTEINMHLHFKSQFIIRGDIWPKQAVQYSLMGRSHIVHTVINSWASGSVWN